MSWGFLFKIHDDRRIANEYTKYRSLWNCFSFFFPSLLGEIFCGNCKEKDDGFISHFYSRRRTLHALLIIKGLAIILLYPTSEPSAEIQLKLYTKKKKVSQPPVHFVVQFMYVQVHPAKIAMKVRWQLNTWGDEIGKVNLETCLLWWPVFMTS